MRKLAILTIVLVMLIVFTVMTLDSLNANAKEVRDINVELKQRVERLNDDVDTLQFKLDNSDPVEITSIMLWVYENKELFEGVGE